jgi:hypothetical protein
MEKVDNVYYFVASASDDELLYPVAVTIIMVSITL